MFRKFTFTLLLATFLTLAAPSLTSAQETGYHKAIMTNPLGLIFGVLNVTYEQQFAPKNSFTASAYLWTYSGWTAFGVGGSYRFYLLQEQERAIKGFSFGPLAQVNYWSYGGDNITYENSVVLNIGAEASYKWIFDGGWTVEPTFQIFFPLMNVTGLGGLGNYGFGANLGYAW